MALVMVWDLKRDLYIPLEPSAGPYEADLARYGQMFLPREIFAARPDNISLFCFI